MDSFQKAKEVLEQGGVLIYPTETVFAFGCLISNQKAVEKLYKIKMREANQPTAAVFPNLSLVKEYVQVGPMSEILAEEFWPGPLTLCLPSQKNLPGLILGPGETLGVRIPANKWLLNLLSTLNKPILAPSANFKGKNPPTKLAEIDKELIKLVDYVVPLEPDGNKPSTIIIPDEDKEVYNIVRLGNITKEQIDQVLVKGAKL